MKNDDFYTREEIARYLELRKKRFSRQEIADKFNVSITRVSNALKSFRFKKYNLNNEDDLAEKFNTDKNLIINASELINQELFKGATSQLFKPEDLYVKDYSKNKEKEIAVLHLTDLHIGKKNETLNFETNKLEETYNFQIFQMELRKLRKAIQKL